MKKLYTLEGVDGNAFSVMGYVARAMRETGKTDDEIKEYREAAMSGDYTNLLFISMLTIDNLNSAATGGTP